MQQEQEKEQKQGQEQEQEQQQGQEQEQEQGQEQKPHQAQERSKSRSRSGKILPNAAVEMQIHRNQFRACIEGSRGPSTPFKTRAKGTINNLKMQKKHIVHKRSG